MILEFNQAPERRSKFEQLRNHNFSLPLRILGADFAESSFPVHKAKNSNIFNFFNQDHIQSQHTRVRCKTCSNRLELLQIRSHDRDSCSQKAKSYKAEIPESPIPTSIRNPSVPSTGIHFLSHFLEDRSPGQVHGSGLEVSDRQGGGQQHHDEVGYDSNR